MFKIINTDFINLCVQGHALPDEIDDFIDKWHDSDTDKEIYEFLGMLQSEYRLWLHDPDMVSFIVTSRVQKRSLDAVLADFNDLPMAARADSPETAKRLMNWLKKQRI